MQSLWSSNVGKFQVRVGGTDCFPRKFDRPIMLLMFEPRT
jgi:hypothetical protein